MKRILILLGIAFAIVALVLVAKFAGKGTQSTVSVKTIVVKTAVFQTKLPENGVVQHPRVATIPTLVGGNIDQLYAKAGDTVAGGQSVATILNPSLQSTAAGSQADYDSAQANVETARIQEQNARVTYQGQLEYGQVEP